MSRSVNEWVGRSDDSKIPDRVRQRVFDRDDGICHICKLTIKVPYETWQADHVVALINGGENRETNLSPAHSPCHIGKTAIDLKEKSKVAKIRAKFTGVKRAKSGLSRPKLPKPPISKPLPPRRNMYEERQP